MERWKSVGVFLYKKNTIMFPSFNVSILQYSYFILYPFVHEKTNLSFYVYCDDNHAHRLLKAIYSTYYHDRNFFIF